MYGLLRTGRGLCRLTQLKDSSAWRLWSKKNLWYVEQDGDLWAEEMAIPLAVIHNWINIHNRKVWKVFVA